MSSQITSIAVVKQQPLQTRAAQAASKKAETQTRVRAIRQDLYQKPDDLDWGDPGTYYEPISDFETLIVLARKFAIVRAIIDVTVNRTIAEKLTLVKQVDNPDSEQKKRAQHFLDTAAGTVGMRQLLRKWLTGYLTIGFDALEVTKNTRGWPMQLAGCPAYLMRKLLNGDWFLILEQTSTVNKETKKEEYQTEGIYFQEYGTKRKDGKWAKLIDDRGKLIGDGFTIPGFELSTNEVLILCDADDRGPHYGLPDIQGAIDHMVDVFERLTDDIINRIQRPFPVGFIQVCMSDSGATDEDGTEDPHVTKIKKLLRETVEEGMRDLIVVGRKPGVDGKTVEFTKLEAELPPNALELVRFAEEQALRASRTPGQLVAKLDKTANLSSDGGRFQIKEWFENKAIPLQGLIEDKFDRLFIDLETTDYAARFAPLGTTPEEKKLDAERNEIDIRSGVVTPGEVREERGLSKADGKDEDGKAKDEKKSSPQRHEGTKESGTTQARAATANPQSEIPDLQSPLGWDGEVNVELFDADVEEERGKFAEVLLALLLALPGIGTKAADVDGMVAAVADKIVEAGYENIPEVLGRFKARIEREFGITLSDTALAEIAGAAKQKWEGIVRDRWLGSRQSVDQLIERLGTEDPEALSEAAANWPEKTFKQRFLMAAGAALLIEQLRQSTLHTAQSVAREATARPVERIRKQAAVVMEEEDPEALVEWRTRSLKPCEDCIRLEAGNPYKPSELSTTPGAGDTRCRHNCHCIIVPIGTEVKQQTVDEYLAHQDELKVAAKERRRITKEMTDLYNTDIEAYTAVQKANADALLAKLKGKASGE